MKQMIKMAAIAVAATTMMVACGSKDGFETTEQGLHYRFDKQNSDGQQVQDGDVLVGEMTVRFDTMQLFTTGGKATRIAQATPSFPGGLYEGLLMMHVGDQAVFAIEADSLAKYLQAGQMPPTYEPGKGMLLYYEINLQDIVTREEFASEQSRYMQDAQQRQSDEPAEIAAYVKEHGITAKPTADGLYVIGVKKGKGAKVATGKEVSVNYTGHLLDGTIFDSSVESDARRGEIYNAERKYEPMTYVVGRDKLIDGWEQGVMGQPAGTVLQLVIPSQLAYGPRGAGNLIPPYSPLVFDIEILSVK